MVLAVAAAFSPPAKQTTTARHKARAGISRCRGGGGGALAISPDGLQLRRPGQVRVVLCCSAAPWFVTPMPIHSYSRSRVRKLLLRSSDLCIVLRVFDACFLLAPVQRLSTTLLLPESGGCPCYLRGTRHYWYWMWMAPKAPDQLWILEPRVQCSRASLSREGLWSIIVCNPLVRNIRAPQSQTVIWAAKKKDHD